MTVFIMMLGMIAAGSAVVFVKIGGVDPFVLASYRQLIAAALLFPLFLRDLKQEAEPFRFSRLRPSILPGIFLALHFITWILGARMIPGGHASVITTMSPVFMPFLLFFLIREKPAVREVLGTILALSGAFFLGLKDSRYAASYLTGDLLCFASMIFVTVYLALARRNRKKTRLWFYMVPLYITGGLLCLLFALITRAPLIPAGTDDWISILGLAVICTVAGHSINNYGMRKLRGQLVSLLNLTQIVFSTLLAFLVFTEVPPAYFYPAALIILSGPLVVILLDKRGGKTGAVREEPA